MTDVNTEVVDFNELLLCIRVFELQVIEENSSLSSTGAHNKYIRSSKALAAVILNVNTSE